MSNRWKNRGITNEGKASALTGREKRANGYEEKKRVGQSSARSFTDKNEERKEKGKRGW